MTRDDEGLETEKAFYRKSEILVGFGTAEILLDGEVVYDGEKRMQVAKSWDDLLTFGHAEAVARQFPDSKLEVVLNGPFWGKTWEWRDDWWIVTGENGGSA